MSIIAAASTSKAAVASSKALITTMTRALDSGVNIRSLADLSRPCRVEPITIIDKSLVHQPYMETIMKYGLSQFTGYYLQAANMLMNVNKVKTLKVFDSLNPERSIGSIGDMSFGMEAYSKGLPNFKDTEGSRNSHLIAHSISTEDAKSADQLLEVPNLAVGKLVTVDVDQPDNEGKSTGKVESIPVMIRLIPAPIDSDIVTQIFTGGGKQSWTHRLFLAKTGQIRFWRDFVLGTDLIDAHFNALVKDKTGTYAAIHKRRSENTKKAIMTGKVSMGDASNIAIVSSDTIRKAANNLYGKIDNAAVRKTIFDNSLLLMLMVVDPYYQRVTIYHRGLDLSSTYRIDELEMKERGKGSDITEIFKMFSKQMQTNI